MPSPATISSIMAVMCMGLLGAFTWINHNGKSSPAPIAPTNAPNRQLAIQVFQSCEYIVCTEPFFMTHKGSCTNPIHYQPLVKQPILDK